MPNRKLPASYSENLVCFFGRFTIVIIDIDKEKTLFQSKADRFAYEWTFQQIQQKKKADISEHPIQIDYQTNQQNPFCDRRI